MSDLRTKERMGFAKEERSKRVIRAIKTVFFLMTMLISILFFSAPVLVAVADTILPSALLSASSPFLSPQSLSFHFSHYDFRYSLIDIPFISFLRSLVIFCVYSCCDGPKLSRGPYLWVVTVCSVLSLVFVSLKAPFVFGRANGGDTKSMEVALFVCSYVLAVGHVFVAYRTSCRERKKLLVYRIDIEADIPNRFYAALLRQPIKITSITNTVMIDATSFLYLGWLRFYGSLN